VRGRVRGGADGSAALNVPVVAIDDNFSAVTDQEEVPVDNCDEDTAAYDVAEAGWNHALPDIVLYVLQSHVSQILSEREDQGYELCLDDGRKSVPLSV
jgi:hypothetical protein